VGLKEGVHDFEFMISSTFFEEMQSEEVMDLNLNLQLNLEKKTNLLILNFHFSGSFNTLCDRCGDDISLALDFSEVMFVKISDDINQDDDINVVTIKTGESQLDISNLVYELIMVNLPFRRVHPDDEKGDSLCNQATLELLKEEIPIEKETDLRWEALKNLKLDN
jgi:uncharacterized protein